MVTWVLRGLNRVYVANFNCERVGSFTRSRGRLVRFVSKRLSRIEPVESEHSNITYAPSNI